MKMRIKTVSLFIFTLAIITSSYSQKNYSKTGIASFYADKFEGRQTANGEIYYHVKKTAAHRTLPFGSIVKVTNLENNKYVVVRVNDRGPFVDNRIIDLSKSAAQDLDFVEKGLAKVRVELIANTNELPDEKKKKVDKSTHKSTYYRINSQQVYPKGKGVQIGSYTSDENMIKLISKLEKQISEPIFVEVAQIKKKKVYRIIVGNTSSENKAELIQKKLKKQFPDCFIVEFKTNPEF